MRFNQQQTQFLPTGVGQEGAVKSPNFPATAQNANGLLHNRGMSDRDGYLHKLFIFCTGWSTGWSIGGQYSQAATGRAFYPRNLTQNEITIEGVCANQHEYDKLVAFVSNHHQRAVSTIAPQPNLSNATDTRPVLFYLKPYQVLMGHDRNHNPVYRTIHNSMLVEGYILNIEAGHQAGVYAPTFSIPLRVSHDYLGDWVRYDAEFNKALQTDFVNGVVFKNPKKAAKPTTQGRTVTDNDTYGTPDFWHQHGPPGNLDSPVPVVTPGPPGHPFPHR